MAQHSSVILIVPSEPRRLRSSARVRRRGPAAVLMLSGLVVMSMETTVRLEGIRQSGLVSTSNGSPPQTPNSSRGVHEPTDENCHVEVAVRSVADGRFIPCLTVRATLSDANGKVVGSHELPFLWHPWVYHYGCNWVVPQDGSYRLQVHIETPTFPRHDRRNGDRFRTAVDVEFDVKIRRGRKTSRSKEAA